MNLRSLETIFYIADFLFFLIALIIFTPPLYISAILGLAVLSIICFLKKDVIGTRSFLYFINFLSTLSLIYFNIIFALIILIGGNIIFKKIFENDSLM